LDHAVRQEDGDAHELEDEVDARLGLAGAGAGARFSRLET
jgi:hypothetical protein